MNKPVAIILIFLAIVMLVLGDEQMSINAVQLSLLFTILEKLEEK